MDRGPLPDTWYRRDFPVLIEIVRRFEAGTAWVSPNELQEALAMTDVDVRAALLALHRRHLIVGTVADSYGAPATVIAVTDVAGDAYVMTGLHPGDDDIASLVDAFRQAAEQTPDADEQSRLRRIASALGELTGDVGKRALAAYIAAQIPR